MPQLTPRLDRFEGEAACAHRGGSPFHGTDGHDSPLPDGQPPGMSMPSQLFVLGDKRPTMLDRRGEDDAIRVVPS